MFTCKWISNFENIFGLNNKNLKNSLGFDSFLVNISAI